LWRTAALTGAAGIEMAVSIVIGYFGGKYLDGKFGTTPWMMWVGFAAGVGAAVKAVVRVVRMYQRTIKQEDADRDAGRKL
jgi:ATP synthase protein I